MMAIKRVLIVDDSPTERHVLNDMLTKAGYEVVASDNGEDAILKAKTVKPDLILMDIELPDGNGLALTAWIKRNRRISSIPVVALTSHVRLDQRAAASEAGCAGFISKPIGGHRFVKQVEAYLAARE